ncbi:galactosyltransferase, partial [Yersinia enterocolitica]|nr:galactosyltransferase [Yersinia enterocolitica]
MKECKSVCIIQNSIKTVVVFRLSYIKQLLSHGHKVYCIAPNDDNESV